jgi:hypothetical protein
MMDGALMRMGLGLSSYVSIISGENLAEINKIRSWKSDSCWYKNNIKVIKYLIVIIIVRYFFIFQNYICELLKYYTYSNIILS